MRGVRVLSVEVTSKGFAFAVLEGPERLVDWGGRDVHGDVSVFLKRLGGVVERYRPDTFVLEEPAGSRKGPRARDKLAWAEQYAVDCGLKTRAVGRRELAAYAPGAGCHKHDLAIAVARQFSELASNVPGPRKPWESETRAIAVFVAVARGCTAMSETGFDSVKDP
jgi:hypothetical protein